MKRHRLTEVPTENLLALLICVVSLRARSSKQLHRALARRSRPALAALPAQRGDMLRNVASAVAPRLRAATLPAASRAYHKNVRAPSRRGDCVAAACRASRSRALVRRLAGSRLAARRSGTAS